MRTVQILAFPEVEVLDFAGPFEVFSVTGRYDPPGPRFQVQTVSTGGDLAPVPAVGGLRFVPDHTLQSAPRAPDVLVVPGGRGTRRLLADDDLRAWLRDRGPRAGILASVCTGSLLLGRAGLLDGHRATSHWQTFDLLRQCAPAATVVEDEHVVRAAEGRLWTSAGISAGIDLALRLVAQLEGEALARTTARQMEYPFPDSNHRRV